MSEEVKEPTCQDEYLRLESQYIIMMRQTLAARRSLHVSHEALTKAASDTGNSKAIDFWTKQVRRDETAVQHHDNERAAAYELLFNKVQQYGTQCLMCESGQPPLEPTDRLVPGAPVPTRHIAVSGTSSDLQAIAASVRQAALASQIELLEQALADSDRRATKAAAEERAKAPPDKPDATSDFFTSVPPPADERDDDKAARIVAVLERGDQHCYNTLFVRRLELKEKLAQAKLAVVAAQAELDEESCSPLDIERKVARRTRREEEVVAAEGRLAACVAEIKAFKERCPQVKAPINDYADQ